MAYNDKKKGILWVNVYTSNPFSLSNLDNSGSNAIGFYDQLHGQSGFRFGDYPGGSGIRAAYDTDIQQQYVVGSLIQPGKDHLISETADIVYFCGHGDKNGVFFGKTDPTIGVIDFHAHYLEISLGTGPIKWLVFDSCKTLENQLVGGSNTIFERWTNAFTSNGGLHYILGFHNSCMNDNLRGSFFATFLNPYPSLPNKGILVRDAWKYACELTDTAQWAYLRVGGAGSPIAEDRWTDEVPTSVPVVPQGGSQTFTYVKKAVTASTTIQIIN